MYQPSSSSSYRTFKSPFKTKTVSKVQSESQSNRNIDTPLTFAEKLDRWKKRMSTSSSYSTPLKNKGAIKSSNFPKCASKSKRRNSFAQQSHRVTRTSSSHHNPTISLHRDSGAVCTAQYFHHAHPVSRAEVDLFPSHSLSH